MAFKRINVYPVYVSYSEMGSEVFGYCQNTLIGEEASKGKGWYGGDGRVNNSDKVDAVIDEDSGIIYVKPPSGNNILLDRYVEIKQIKEQRIANLKAKLKDLSPGEIALLKENIKEI